jgi:hypothetical protein
MMPSTSEKLKILKLVNQKERNIMATKKVVKKPAPKKPAVKKKK